MASLPMASQFSKSASSSSLSPTSISKHDYDVFLSFCREDEGKIFTDHLYAALVEKGLHPFKEAISASESLMAIEKSKFSLLYSPETMPIMSLFLRFSIMCMHLTCGNKCKVTEKHFPNMFLTEAEAGNLTGYVLDHEM